MLGFSPSVFYVQLFAIPQRLKPESKMGPLAARLRSCPDACRSLKVVLQVALLFAITQHQKPEATTKPEWLYPGSITPSGFFPKEKATSHTPW
jgi:hypothetical protein